MWIDTHAHLSDDAFEDRLQEVLERAENNDVRQLICVGTTVRSSKASIGLADQYPQVFASAGIHPNNAHHATETDWRTIEQLIAHEKVVAVGETGLDKYWDDCPWDTQIESFHRQIEWSIRYDKPLIIHTRDCEAEMVEVLERVSKDRTVRGVMHSFAGSWETAERCLAIGMHISFAGMVTYKKSHALRDVVKRIPSDRILVETDSPYLSPEPKRSTRPNEPSLIVYTAQCVAECRGISMDELASITTENAVSLFRLPSLVRLLRRHILRIVLRRPFEIDLPSNGDHNAINCLIDN